MVIRDNKYRKQWVLRTMGIADDSVADDRAADGRAKNGTTDDGLCRLWGHGRYMLLQMKLLSM